MLAGVVVAVVVIIIVALVAGLMSGYLYVGFKSPKQQVIAQYRVCDSKIIDSYNESFRKDTEEARGAALQRVVDDIEKRTAYLEDPSCVYMVAQHYMHTFDFAKTGELYSVFSGQVDRGLYPSSRINNVQSSSAFKAQTKIYETIQQSSTDAESAVGGG